MKKGTIIFGQDKGHLHSIQGEQVLSAAKLPQDIMDMCLIKEEKWLACACGHKGGLSIINENLIVQKSYLQSKSLVAVSYFKENKLLVQHSLLILFDYNLGQQICQFNIHTTPFNLIPIAGSNFSGRGKVFTNEPPQNSAQEISQFILQSEKKLTLLTIEEQASGFECQVVTIAGKSGGHLRQGLFVEKKQNEIVISTSDRKGSIRSFLQYKLNIA
ncbi:hypothetical protein FGO68_gene6007 [Halteria grandinella]|uniref:Uncharacterized protein n=1 Tax=Halteria grandinella TaxID=5974 RepID=A0A8J8NVX3_HALGN|nr:hypothetical protein FGO68_gene6007 [Halteria grandinella]